MSTHLQNQPGQGSYQSLRSEILSLGGVTNLQPQNNELFAGCLPIAENGILGSLTLKASMKLFTILDVFLGIFYFMFLVQEVIFEWTYFNVNGPHYFLTAFYFMRVAYLPMGLIGFVGAMKQNIVLSKAYFNLVLVQLLIFPALGLASTYDMCNSYVYYEPCKNIFLQNSMFSALRIGYLFYVAYIAKSFYRRLERGEIILVNHGRSIVELINQVQNNNQGGTGGSRGQDIELVAVQGIAMAEGQVIVPGGTLDDIELPKSSKKGKQESTVDSLDTTE
eukprot:403346044